MALNAYKNYTKKAKFSDVKRSASVEAKIEVPLGAQIDQDVHIFDKTRVGNITFFKV